MRMYKGVRRIGSLFRRFRGYNSSFRAGGFGGFRRRRVTYRSSAFKRRKTGKRIGRRRLRIGLRKRYGSRRTRQLIQKTLAAHKYIRRECDIMTMAENVQCWRFIRPLAEGDWQNFIKWWHAGSATAAHAVETKLWFCGGKIQYQLRNNSTQPHVCTKYTLKPRKDIPMLQADGTPFPLLSGSDNPPFIQKCFTDQIGEEKMTQATSAPAYTTVGVVPTDSQLFGRFWKILRVKQKTMAPGEIWKWKVKIRGDKFPRNFTGFTDLTASTSTAIQYLVERTLLPFMYLFRCHGEIGQGADNNPGTTGSSMIIDAIRKFTLRVITDATPSVGIWDSNPYVGTTPIKSFNPIAAANQ